MLTEEQKADVAKWFAAGASLDEIQKRMKTEFGVHMTYLDLRLMVADLPQPVETEPAAPDDPAHDDPTRDGPAREVPAPPRRVASSSGTAHDGPAHNGPAHEVPAPPRRVASSSGTPSSGTSSSGTSSSGTPDSSGTSSSGPASDDGTSAAPKRYDLDAPDGTPPASDLTVEVDALTIPGTFASGAVTFSDGTKAKWYLDQLGRLGLDDVPPGYRPSPGDAALFQSRLVEALRARGLA